MIHLFVGSVWTATILPQRDDSAYCWFFDRLICGHIKRLRRSGITTTCEYGTTWNGESSERDLDVFETCLGFFLGFLSLSPSLSSGLKQGMKGFGQARHGKIKQASERGIESASARFMRHT